jgi:hypothetical protein
MRVLNPAGPREDRLRSAPSTSTTSPSRHLDTVRRCAAPHALQSTQSTDCRDPLVIGEGCRGTDTRTPTTALPLGSSRSVGPAQTLPRSRTLLCCSESCSRFVLICDHPRSSDHGVAPTPSTRLHRGTDGARKPTGSLGANVW